MFLVSKKALLVVAISFFSHCHGMINISKMIKGNSAEQGGSGVQMVALQGRKISKDYHIQGPLKSVTLPFGKLHIEQVKDAAEEKMVILSNENTLPLIEPVIRDQALSFNLKQDCQLRDSEALSIHLKVCSLEKILLSGTGSVTLSDNFKLDNFEVSILGKGDLAAKGLSVTNSIKISISGMTNSSLYNINCSNIKVNFSGMGSLTLTGEANNQIISMSGMGKIDMVGLRGKGGRIFKSSLGLIEVNLDEAFEGVALSAADICNYGAGKMSFSQIQKKSTVISTGRAGGVFVLSNGAVVTSWI